MKNNTLLFVYLFLLTMNFSYAQHSGLQYKTIQEKRFYPVKIEKTDTNCYFITFEKAYFGKLQLDIHASQNDSLIVKLGEKSTNNKSVDTNPPGTVRYLTDILTIKEQNAPFVIQPHEFTPPGWAKDKNLDIKLPDSIGNVLPFRYVEIQGYSGELTKKQVQQIAYYYPFNDSASFLQTSNQALYQVWSLCKHTIKATSFTGLYIDGDRERRPYEGDAYINQLSHYAVDAEYALARKTIDYLFENPTWPTEWAYHNHLMLWADYMYTGKTDFLKKYYADLKKITQNAPLNEQGLLTNANGTDIIDWPRSERDSYRLGMVNNVPNTFYNKSLRILTKMAGILGYKNDSIDFSQKAVEHAKTFNNCFWNTQSGLYLDAVDSLHSSLHANVFPLVFDLVPDAKKKQIMPFIKSKGMAVSVYGSQYLLDALYKSGENEYALQLITATNERSWLNMIAKGGTITWEAWNEKVKENLDWNHAWGTAPANIIARRIFGIRPLEAGFAKAIIQPQFNNLDSGKIIHPTIKGDIEVQFTNSSIKNTMELNLPVAAKIILPVIKKRNKTITLNNKSITPTIDKKHFILELQEGEYSIVY